jgi:hypothetical protein
MACGVAFIRDVGPSDEPMRTQNDGRPPRPETRMLFAEGTLMLHLVARLYLGRVGEAAKRAITRS